MNSRLCILIGAIILFSVSASATTRYMEAQVVCQLEAGVDPDSMAAALGATVLDRLEAADTYLFDFSQPDPVDVLISYMEALPTVRYAQPNYVINIFDLLQTSQPFVDQTSQPFVDGESPPAFYRQYTDEQMMIDEVLATGITGEGIVVAVIDGGLDRNHPLFENRLHDVAYDFVENDNKPWTDYGTLADHGTFVAGIIARAAPAAQLMIVRSFGSTGNGTSFNITRGIYFAVEHGVQVINMSFGMYDEDQAINDAIELAHYFDVVMTASAGNNDLQADQFPASHPYVLNVAAVDSADVKADFSNYSPTVAFTAPGVDVYGPLSGGDVWGWWCGTSFSTPYVSALAALLKSQYGEWTPEMIAWRMETNAIDIRTLNPHYETLLGTGRINFFYSTYICGDANRSGGLNLGDAVSLINYVFKQGDPPVPLKAGDASNDDAVNVGDAVYMINYIFRNGPPPVCPE